MRIPDYNNPDGYILGIISAMMNFGSVAAIPFVPFCNDRWGRRFVILLGSFSALVGIAIQTGAINRECGPVKYAT
jgi:MFS family permease